MQDASNLSFHKIIQFCVNFETSTVYILMLDALLGAQKKVTCGLWVIWNEDQMFRDIRHQMFRDISGEKYETYTLFGKFSTDEANITTVYNCIRNCFTCLVCSICAQNSTEVYDYGYAQNSTRYAEEPYWHSISLALLRLQCLGGGCRDVL